MKVASTQVRDQMDTVLRNARASLDLALTLHQHQLTDTSIRHYDGDDALWAASMLLIGGASHDVALAVQDLPALGSAAGDLPHLLSRLRGRRLSIRLLCAPSALLTLQGRADLQELGRRGVDVRVARHGLNDFAVVDGRYVVVRTGRAAEPDAGPGLVVEARALARTVLALLGEVHGAAGRLDTFLRYNDPDKAELVVAILGLLSRGCKDATAARTLGLSVRTYRRRVAEVLSWLDVTSRFEAGVRAAELGLVRPEALNGGSRRPVPPQ